jgi:hypothetical protein
MEERELAEIRQIAQRHGLTVSEWTRQVVRSARRRESVGDPARKLHAIRSAVDHSFPVGDVSSMLADIERGYLGHDAA